MEELVVPKFDQTQFKEAYEWVKETFPYEVRPTENPGVGQDIMQWLTENIGPMDNKWTYLGDRVRFRDDGDYALYILT